MKLIVLDQKMIKYRVQFFWRVYIEGFFRKLTKTNAVSNIPKNEHFAQSMNSPCPLNEHWQYYSHNVASNDYFCNLLKYI